MASVEDIEWAAKAYADGRALDFIASVIGEKPKKTFAMIRDYRSAQDRRVAASRTELSVQRQSAERAFQALVSAPGERKVRPNFILIDEEGRFSDRPHNIDQAAAIEREARAIKRRRFLLSCMFSRHWNMIWFLRACGMSGRTIRQIYGAETLIWSVGGGIDAAA